MVKRNREALLNTKKSRIYPYIPNELWLEILEFVPIVTDAYSLSLCNSKLLHHWLNNIKLIRYASSKSKRFAVSLCSGRKSQMATLTNICQLCGKVLRNGCPQVIWDIYAHTDCLSRELIHYKDANNRYDIMFENMRTLRSTDGRIWKYHGGRSYLNFTLNDTLQGLCIRKHHESLFDRGVRLELIKNEFTVKTKQNNEMLHTNLDKFKKILAVEKELICRNKEKRLKSLSVKRISKLDTIFSKNSRLLDPLLKDIIIHIYTHHIRIPVSWKILPSIISELITLQNEWYSIMDKSETRESFCSNLVLHHKAHIVLNPQKFIQIVQSFDLNENRVQYG